MKLGFQIRIYSALPFLVFFFIIFGFHKLYSQGTDFKWANKAGGSHNDGSTDVSVDNLGAEIELPENGIGSYRLVVGKEDYAKLHSENSALAPGEFTLYQNYPNPFNPTTHITYKLRERSLVSLEIYDVLGRKIKSLVENEFQNPGLHNYIWNGKNENGKIASSGMYIYRIHAGDFIDSKTMILLK